MVQKDFISVMPNYYSRINDSLYVGTVINDSDDISLKKIHDLKQIL